MNVFMIINKLSDLKAKKDTWLPCKIQELYSKHKIRPFFGLLRCDSRLRASRVLKMPQTMAHVIRFQSLYILSLLHISPSNTTQH